METNLNENELPVVDEPAVEIDPAAVEVDPPAPVEEVPPPVDTSVKYKLVVSEVTYPLVDTVVGEEVIEGVVHLEQVFLEDGKPDIDIVEDDKGNAIKRVKFIEVPKKRKLVEALPDKAGAPDGILYEVLVWGDGTDEKDAIPLKFHIGREAFEHVTPEERAGVLHKEIEIKFRAARPSWLEGLELVASDAK